MKLKDKIKILASMGIIVSTSSCVENDNMITTPNYLMKSNNENIKTEFNSFTPLKGISISTKLEKELLVLGRLASDVLKNHNIAFEFTKNPKEYFHKNGIMDVDLNLESVEVKVILALGDSDIRKALSTNNISKFVNLLYKKKYIDYNNFNLNSSLKSYFDYHKKNNPDFEKLFEKYSGDTSIEAVFAVPVWVVAVVVEEVAVAYNVGVGVNFGAIFNIYAWTNTYGDPMSDTLSNMDSYVDYNVGITMSPIPSNQNNVHTLNNNDNLKFNNPVLKLWSYNNNGKDVFVIEEIIEKNVEETLKIIKNIDVFKNSQKKMDEKKLRDLLRAIFAKRLSEAKIF